LHSTPMRFGLWNQQLIGPFRTSRINATRANVPDYIFSRKENGTDWSNYRVVSDHLGSPRLVVDTATGAIVQELDYDEFGRVLNNNTNPTFQPFGFAGGLYEPQTGLVRFTSRSSRTSKTSWRRKRQNAGGASCTNPPRPASAPRWSFSSGTGGSGGP